ncbi:MAG TPA: radical SAM protein, partial [Treponema sp.]|nr:radical SAM protein [Treponema sp.]
MGEPLLHPQIDVCVNEAVKKGFKVHITSNGSLLSQVRDTLVDTGLKRLNLSL